MMTLRLLVVLLLPNSFAFALDFTKTSDGTPGYWSSQSREFAFTQTDSDSQHVIWKLLLRPPAHNQTYHVISGEVRHFNVGAPMDGVAVFFGTDNDHPRLAGFSDAAGRFSFRLYPVDDAKRRANSIILPNHGPRYLYFGGAISTLKKQGNLAPLLSGDQDNVLSEDSLTRRYRIDTLFK
jgi:hypothetical protein